MVPNDIRHGLMDQTIPLETPFLTIVVVKLAIIMVMLIMMIPSTNLAKSTAAFCCFSISSLYAMMI